MVDVPKDDAPTGQHKQLPAQPGKRPVTPPAGRTPTGQQKRPVTDQAARTPTAQVKQPDQPSDRKKTAPVAQSGGNTQQKKRSTQLLSLEPPKTRRGVGLGKMNTRLDSMAGPVTKDQRNRQLFGGIGREKTGQTDVMQPVPGGQSAAAQRPSLRKPGQKNVSVDLGGSAAEVDGMIARRKATRVIPKSDGKMEGDNAPLSSMGSGRRAPAVDPGPPARNDLPPIVNIPIPQPRQTQRREPPPPGNRGNTLAGVSAEDLLGPEGRQMLENMRKREQQTRMAPAPQPQAQPPRPPAQARPLPPRPQQNNTLPPRTQDSGRQAFQSAEYSAELEQEQSDDELRPQGNFLSGPAKAVQGEVVQTPMPAQDEYGQSPPPDDLGYEKPVDFGDGSAGPQEVVESDYDTGVIEGGDPAGGGTEEEPTARESAAHDEMEQRAGYLLWLQGVITREEVDDALTGADEIGEPVRDLLVNTAFADQITLYRFLARHESLAPVDLEQVQPTDRALASLRPAIARAYRVIPIDKIGELLLVAAAFPFDPKRLLELRRLTASKVELFVVTEEEIDIALMKYYPGGAASAATLRSPKPAGLGSPVEHEQESAVTGEGESLESNYDPTLSGSDSGLYAPMEDAERDDPGEPADVEMSELDDEKVYGGSVDSGAEDGADAEAEAGTPVGNTDDLDESTLGGARPPKAGSQAPDTRPEDLDPFAE